MATTYSTTHLTESGTLDDSTLYIIDMTDTDVDLTLPAVSGLNGRYYIIKRPWDESTNILTIYAAENETINGSSSMELNTGETVGIACNESASDWINLYGAQ